MSDRTQRLSTYMKNISNKYKKVLANGHPSKLLKVYYRGYRYIIEG